VGSEGDRRREAAFVRVHVEARHGDPDPALDVSVPMRGDVAPGDRRRFGGSGALAALLALAVDLHRVGEVGLELEEERDGRFGRRVIREGQPVDESAVDGALDAQLDRVLWQGRPGHVRIGRGRPADEDRSPAMGGVDGRPDEVRLAVPDEVAEATKEAGVEVVHALAASPFDRTVVARLERRVAGEQANGHAIMPRTPLAPPERGRCRAPRPARWNLARVRR
jgi:hypothetical protein